MLLKMWYEKTWDELGTAQLIKLIKQWSDAFDFGALKPSEEEVTQYYLMYEKAEKEQPNDYTLLGCVNPKYFI